MNGSVLFVCVSYFGSGDVGALLESLRVPGLEHRVLIVDNSESEAEHANLRDLVDPTTTLLTAPRNLGYFGGARWALSMVDQDADWVVVCNTDLVFEPDFLVVLAGLQHHDILAPTITSVRTGRDQNPYLITRPGRREVRRWRLQFSWVPLARLSVVAGAVASRLRPAGPRAAGVIYAPHGSCVVIPKEYFQRGGTLSHEPFLFGEEISLAEECRALGIAVRYQPSLRVRHLEHAATGLWRSRQALVWQRQSIAHVARLLTRPE